MPGEYIRGPKARYLFFGLGAVTVFLDYLSTPLVALGLPVVALMFSHEETLEQMSAPEAVKTVLALIGAWLGGWLLLGMTNWIIYTLASPDLSQATEGIRIRFMNWVGGSRFDELGYSRISGLRMALELAAPHTGAFKFLIALGAAALIPAAAPVRRFRGIRISCALVSLLPLVWFLVLSTSVAQHVNTAYRSIVAAIFALLCSWYYLFRAAREKR